MPEPIDLAEWRDDDIDEWQEAYERAVDGLGPYPSTEPDWKELLSEGSGS